MRWDTEELLTLRDACRLVPGRTGKGIALSTLWRWIQRGYAGVRLDSIRIGTQRYVSRQSMQRFVRTINERALPEGDSSSFMQSSDASPNSLPNRDVEAALDREGL